MNAFRYAPRAASVPVPGAISWAAHLSLLATPTHPTPSTLSSWATDTVTPTPGGGGDGHGGKELQNWSTLIGIVTAIIGNVLIALALNVQRYAHIRLERKRKLARRKAQEALRRIQNGRNSGIYGSTTSFDTPADHWDGNGHGNGTGRGSGAFGSDSRDSDPLAQAYQSNESLGDVDGDDEEKSSITYLKSSYWWMGQILITVGELGNFLAYGFAPASIVSLLGVVALIANCIIAPILFHEKFRQRDFWGVAIAVTGAVTVVLSANQEETKLDPHDVWDAINTLEFKLYLLISISLIVILMMASPKYGNKTILIDLGLVGLFGMSSP
jgi:magnesium transporter